MISTFAVVSPPRSGTKWYSALFTHGDVFCYHELTALLEPYPTNVALSGALAREMHDHSFEQQQRRWFLEGYPSYFSRLWDKSEQGCRVVGNSGGYVNASPGLWLLWPETRFLFSVRDGINQVNSAASYEANVPAVDRAQRPTALEDLSAFEVSCRLWVATVGRWTEVRRWLEERGARCLSTRLEDVTAEEAELERVWNWLVGDWPQYAERARSLVGRPLNERVNVGGAIRTAADIWASWPPEHRRKFVAICGETELGLGYAIPGS